MAKQTRRIAVVLAGAVAKGAFEAGVLRALVRADVEIARIVGASAGALNGTVLAAAVRGQRLLEGTDQLAAIWRDRAAWSDVFHVSFHEMIRGEGLSDQARIVALLRDHIAPSQPDAPAEVNLRLVVAALGGCAGSIGARPATTFESVRDFGSGDFATRSGLDGVFAAAAASAAFPIVFAPVEVAGLGPCVDGGSVNNTPVKWAIEGELGAELDAVVVVSTSVEQRTGSPSDLAGLGSLMSHLADMLVEERLYRDLREAEQVNAALAGLDQLVRGGVLDDARLGAVKQALGWTRRRVVPVVAIRPSVALSGSPFSAFLDRGLRAAYLDAGYERGLEVLGGLGWSHRPEPAASVRHDDVVGVAADPVALPGAVERDRAE